MKMPMTLYEARVEYAKKYLEMSKVESDKERDKVACWMENYSLVCYSLPWLRSQMRPWMIDIKFGTENIFHRCKEEVDTDEVVDVAGKVEMLLEDKGKFIEQAGGSIMKQVMDYVVERGYKVSDSGAGCSGGHIGIRCSDVERDELLNLLHIKFKKAIDMGLILPRVAWFRASLFVNDGQVMKFIKDEGLGE